MNRIYINHIGYDSDDTKRAVFLKKQGTEPLSFEIRKAADDAVCFSGALQAEGEVDNWGKGYFYSLRFDDVRSEGEYYIAVRQNDGSDELSRPFKIAPNLLEADTLSFVGYYFRAQRATGEYEAIDRNLPFQHGLIKDRVDAHGGWFDATADCGVHLSHLSHTTYFNPQQAAFAAFALLKMNELLEETDYPYYTMLKRRLMEEGLYGADFLMRMRAPSGGFYASKSRTMDAYGPVASMRVMRAFPRHPVRRYGGSVVADVNDLTIHDYETSFRSGGGYAVAALAVAGRTVYPSDYSRDQYIAAAIKAYDYLYENNNLYTNDGQWNLVDEYCALDAVTEIYRTTREYDYLRRARAMAQKIAGRYVSISEDKGYLSVDGKGRPFFHAADAGMPVVNLMNYYAAEKQEDVKRDILALCEKLMRFELSNTHDAVNPFNVARQYVQHGDGSRDVTFFYPHDVETAPWWQGENARLASLATAARSVARCTADEALKHDLENYADDQINWILGMNPFDSCMLYGKGRNNIDYFFEYKRDFMQCPGGIVNGITSAIDDEHGIAFHGQPTEQLNDNWRWAEEWIPHAAWYMYALGTKRR